eukprot:tig00020912_g15868.t1
MATAVEAAVADADEWEDSVAPSSPAIAPAASPAPPPVENSLGPSSSTTAPSPSLATSADPEPESSSQRMSSSTPATPARPAPTSRVPSFSARSSTAGGLEGGSTRKSGTSVAGSITDLVSRIEDIDRSSSAFGMFERSLRSMSRDVLGMLQVPGKMLDELQAENGIPTPGAAPSAHLVRSASFGPAAVAAAAEGRATSTTPAPPATSATPVQNVHEEFGLPASEFLITNYSCAIQRKILLQGRLFLFSQHICFKSALTSMFGIETRECIALAEVADIQKKNTAFVLPNAIEVTTTKGDKVFFGSFLYRDEAFRVIVGAWKAALGQAPPPEITAAPDGSVHPVPPVGAGVGVGTSAAGPAALPLAMAASLPAGPAAAAPFDPAPLLWAGLQMGAAAQQIADATFPNMDVQRFFALFLSDESGFVADWHRACGHSEIEVTRWEPRGDGAGLQRRVLYRTPIKGQLMGPKSTRVAEQQHYRAAPDGRGALLRSTASNLDVPFADAFSMEMLWSIAAVPGAGGAAAAASLPPMPPLPPSVSAPPRMTPPPALIAVPYSHPRRRRRRRRRARRTRRRRRPAPAAGRGTDAAAASGTGTAPPTPALGPTAPPGATTTPLTTPPISPRTEAEDVAAAASAAPASGGQTSPQTPSPRLPPTAVRLRVSLETKFLKFVLMKGKIEESVAKNTRETTDVWIQEARRRAAPQAVLWAMAGEALGSSAPLGPPRLLALLLALAFALPALLSPRRPGRPRRPGGPPDPAVALLAARVSALEAAVSDLRAALALAGPAGGGGGGAGGPGLGPDLAAGLVRGPGPAGAAGEAADLLSRFEAAPRASAPPSEPAQPAPARTKPSAAGAA